MTEELIKKPYEEIVGEILLDFAEELGVEKISDASDIAIKAKVYAGQIEGIYYNQEFILRQSSPATATGEYLDMWGKSFNVDPRNNATNAIGTVVFGRKTASENDLVIPIGTMVSTDEEVYGALINCITTEKVVLIAGQLEVSIKAKTVEVGVHTNVPPGALTIINNPPTGIEYVKNIERFTDGTDKEEDEAYRLRFEKSKFRGTDTDFENRAKEVDGVTFAKTLERNRGPGTADVLIATANGVPSDELVQITLNHLLVKRPLLCDLGVIKPVSQTVDVSVKVTLKEGFLLTSTVDGLTVLNRIKQAIRIYLKSVGIEGIVRRMGLGDCIYLLDEVVDVEVISPLLNIVLLTNAIAEEGVIDVTTV